MKTNKQYNKENLKIQKNSKKDTKSVNKTQNMIMLNENNSKKSSKNHKIFSINQGNTSKIRKSISNKFSKLNKNSSLNKNNNNIKSTLKQICKGVFVTGQRKTSQNNQQTKFFKNSFQRQKQNSFCRVEKIKQTLDKNSVNLKQQNQRNIDSSSCAQNYQDQIMQKYKSIENLINKIKKIHIPQRKNCGVQTEEPKFQVINLQNLTLLSILKEAACDVLFLDKNNVYQSLIDNAQDDFKKHLIQEIVLMIQEQMLFEEILRIMKDQSIDLEPIVINAYENLGVDISKVEKKQKPKKVKKHKTQTTINSVVLEYIAKEKSPKKVNKKNRHNFCLDLKNIDQFDSDVQSDSKTESEQFTESSINQQNKYYIYYNKNVKRQQ